MNANISKIANLHVHSGNNGNGNGKGNRKLSYKRREIIMNMRQLREKIPDVQITGHPNNIFHIGCRIKSDGQNFFRSLDLGEVRDGGLIVQSSWYENGRPALAMEYRPDLALEWENMESDDGNIRRVPRLTVRRPKRWAFWKWIRWYVLRTVFGI